MNLLLTAINLFSGPFSSLIEKGILSAVMFAVGKGWVAAGDATGIAAAVYTVVSGLYTGIKATQTAKIQDVNATTNGVLVVATAAAQRAGLTPVNEAINDGR